MLTDGMLQIFTGLPSHGQLSELPNSQHEVMLLLTCKAGRQEHAAGNA